jgi:hypothetical protein
MGKIVQVAHLVMTTMISERTQRLLENSVLPSLPVMMRRWKCDWLAVVKDGFGHCLV